MYKRQAEEVQQPEDEPEVIPQEIQPEISQSEKPTSTIDVNILEILRAIKSMKEDLNSKIDENSLSTNQNIESLKEENRSTKEMCIRDSIISHVY